jgi:hypothetical protein
MGSARPRALADRSRNQHRGLRRTWNPGGASELSRRKPNQAIRRTAVKIIVSALALITAIVAIWDATAISAHTPNNPDAATASLSINVMQMTIEAKNLPEEKFDAY